MTCLCKRDSVSQRASANRGDGLVPLEVMRLMTMLKLYCACNGEISMQKFIGVGGWGVVLGKMRVNFRRFFS